MVLGGGLYGYGHHSEYTNGFKVAKGDCQSNIQEALTEAIEEVKSKNEQKEASLLIFGSLGLLCALTISRCSTPKAKSIVIHSPALESEIDYEMHSKMVTDCLSRTKELLIGAESNSKNDE